MGSPLAATTFAPLWPLSATQKSPSILSNAPKPLEQEQTPHSSSSTPSKLSTPAKPTHRLHLSSLVSWVLLCSVSLIDHMDWYLQNDSDLIVPNDQKALEAPFAEDKIPLPSDWCHWGFIKPEKLKPRNLYGGRSSKSSEENFDFDTQSLYNQVSKGPSVHEREESSSSACGQPPFDCSARTSEASVYGQTDFQLQNSMDWMDDIFLNSLLEEDHGNMENQLQSVNMSDSMYGSLSFENSLANVFIDPQSLMMDPARRETSVTCSIPLLTNDISESWGKMEDSSPSMLEELKRSEGSAMDPDLMVLLPAELSASNETDAVTDVNEAKCVGAMVLQEFEDIKIHLSQQMRICFRDALYRLAKNSKEQHTRNQSRSANFIDRQSFMELNSENPRISNGYTLVQTIGS